MADETRMRILLLLICVGGNTVDAASAALRTEVFLEQPQDVTIRESETASFRCYVVNITFSIFWLVNNSDAGYTTFRERGVRVTSLDPMNDTRSLMEIDGNLFNNNTHVHCAAVRDNIDPELAWIESNIALLTVEEYTREEADEIISTVQQVTTQTRVVPISTGLSQLSNTTVYLQPFPKTKKTRKAGDDVTVLLGIIVPVVVSLMIAVIFTLLILLFFRKMRKVADKEIKVDLNIGYELTKPFQLQKNKLYEISSQYFS